MGLTHVGLMFRGIANHMEILLMYIKDSDAAKYLGLSVHTLRDYRRKKTGPKFHKLGRAVRYTTEDLDAWATKEGESCQEV